MTQAVNQSFSKLLLIYVSPTALSGKPPQANASDSETESETESENSSGGESEDSLSGRIQAIVKTSIYIIESSLC